MANHNVIPFPGPSESPIEAAKRRHPASGTQPIEQPGSPHEAKVIPLLPWLLRKHGRAVIQRVLEDETDTPSDTLIHGDDRHDRD